MCSGSGHNFRKLQVMNHKFSGYSVWIEPNDEDFYYSVLRDKMNSLVKRCNSYGVGGGSDHTSFVPHCTLLYSIPSDSDEDVLVESLIKARDDFRLRLDKEESAAAKSLKSNDTIIVRSTQYIITGGKI